MVILSDLRDDGESWAFEKFCIQLAKVLSLDAYIL